MAVLRDRLDRAKVADGWVPAGGSSFQVEAGTCQSRGWEWSLVYTRS
ncbi:hypothetical protein ACWEOE_28140 [Amycolatopsis sp. NPDC004368]